MFSLPWVRCPLFSGFIENDKLYTIVRLIILVFEDSQWVFVFDGVWGGGGCLFFFFSSSKVLRPCLKNYQFASPLLYHHKLNHCHCICHLCPISCLKREREILGIDIYLNSSCPFFFSFSAIFPKERVAEIKALEEMININQILVI